MKDQINTIREALEKMAETRWPATLQKALTALTQLEAMVGEQEPVAEVMPRRIGPGHGTPEKFTYDVNWFTVDPHKWSGKLFAAPVAQQQEPVAKLHDDGYWTPMKTEAGRALNDRLMLAGSPSIDVYAAPVAQQYEAGDVASAAAQGFRDGVASVAQQPPKLEGIEQYRMQMAGISTAAMGYWKEGDSIHPDYDTPALRDVAKLYAKYDALYKAQQPDSITPAELAKRIERGEKWEVAQQPQAEAVPSDVFLTDVMTAAGLVSHGKQCKALGERLMKDVAQLRAAIAQQKGQP